MRGRLIVVLVLLGASMAAVVSPASPVLAQGWVAPTQPEECLDDQVGSGDMANCLLRGSGSPADRGFGLPLDPTVSPGFSFGGWSYSGPAERAWAAEYITSNQTAVAGRGAGTLQFHVATQSLFEGFLDEISGRGYPVSSAGGYVFRCTSATSGSCSGGSMSNHLWGLAADINPGMNPERTYGRVDGKTACATPMVTDVPEWVVQAAQRWGLFWGGYGYQSGGCTSPASESDSVRRDPHHFEFRGTAEQALTISARNGRPAGPVACYDTVSSRGRDVLSCNKTGVPSAFARTPVPVAPPRGASAVLVNLTAANGADPGFLTAEPCGSIPDARSRQTSNTNFVAAAAAANLALVPVARSTDQICVFRSAAVHSIVDVLGYVVDRDNNTDALLFSPVAPRRTSDTRASGTCAPGASCGPGQVPAGGVHQIGGVESAALVNVTIAEPRQQGFATVDRCSALAVGVSPATSTVNFGTGGARANATFVNPDSSGLCAYSHSQADVIVDVSGVLSEEGLGVVAATAKRVLDTRSDCGTGCAAVAARSVTRVPDALGASGSAVVNVTVTQPAAAGFVTAGDCSTLAPGVSPATSTANFVAGQTVANLAFVTATNADLCLFSSAATHLIVDVQAALTDSSSEGFVVGAPVRSADTRN